MSTPVWTFRQPFRTGEKAVAVGGSRPSASSSLTVVYSVS